MERIGLHFECVQQLVEALLNKVVKLVGRVSGWVGLEGGKRLDELVQLFLIVERPETH